MGDGQVTAGSCIVKGKARKVRKLGDGANSLVFLAKCSGGGRLSDHTDTLLALKVLIRHKNQGPQAVLDAARPSSCAR